MVTKKVPSSGERLLTAAQVAEKLGISTRTLYKHISQGTMPPPSTKLNRKLVRWRESDLETFINGTATPSPKN